MAPFGILPEHAVLMQLAEGACDRLETIGDKFLAQLREIQRRLGNDGLNFRGQRINGDLLGRLRLAVHRSHEIFQLHLVSIRIADSVEAFTRHIIRDGRIDTHLGRRRHP